MKCLGPQEEGTALQPNLNEFALRAKTLIAKRLADARRHAEAGHLEAAKECLIELRIGLVGAHPDDDEGLLRKARTANLHKDAKTHQPCLYPGEFPFAPTSEAEHSIPSADRNDWLQASQLSGQAIAELRVAMSISEVSNRNRHSASLIDWEKRHSERVRRWVRTAIGSTSSLLDHPKTAI